MQEKNLSIIVPVLNDVPALERLFEQLDTLGPECEVIVVDGAASDACQQLVEAHGAVYQTSAAGRARQMNHGAKVANGNRLFFLHADSELPKNFVDLLAEQTGDWGRFNIRLSGQQMMFRVIETMMNLRATYTGISTGDQGLVVSRVLFESLGGFAEIPLMEDVEITSRLRRNSSPFVIQQPIKTSSRRWEKNGIWKTIFLMWRLRWRYYWGANPADLHREYYG